MKSFIGTPVLSCSQKYTQERRVGFYRQPWCKETIKGREKSAFGLASLPFGHKPSPRTDRTTTGLPYLLPGLHFSPHRQLKLCHRSTFKVKKSPETRTAKLVTFLSKSRPPFSGVILNSRTID